MKDIKTYILESSQEKKYKNNIPQDIKSFCYKMMINLDYSKLQEINDYDPDRFEKSKENEELLMNSLSDDSYDFMTTSQYYATINKENKWENLSSKEQTEFYRKNGNLIILKNEKPIYFIDIKIGSNNDLVGSINLGSLSEFNENGYYLCIAKKSGKYKIISHKDLVNAVKENPKLLNPVINKSYKGFDITWNGEKLTSEYFIKGSDLNNKFE